MIEISLIKKPSQQLLEALNHLVPQLSSSAPPMKLPALEELLSVDCVNLFIARLGDTGQVVGTLTLVVFPIPTGVRAWVEDVIVDSRQRGKGIGKELVRGAVARAQALGAKTVDLTSRPSRVEANSLYVSMGFVQRETNVYRHELESARK